VQPVVLVVENLHWVDPSTLELLGLVVEQGATVPVLLVLTARPEFRAPWPLLAHHTVITLNRLGKNRVREMVRYLAALPEDLVETIMVRSDGVPLFVEELTKALAERHGTAVRGIPMTLQDSLLARLDALGPAKDVAQVASVFGRECAYALLRVVASLAEAQLVAALGKLADAELLYAWGLPPDASYVFKHALVQEAAYGSLRRADDGSCMGAWRARW
jgi:predicted ATPase